MQLYPAMQAKMGDWTYYVVRMTMREVSREFQLASDLWEDVTLSSAIQRAIDESRVKQQIVNFLSRRDDRFFSSLVVAAIGGNPTWTPFETRFGDCFGELSFERDPRYYALDGQHRLKAIWELLSDPAGAPSGFADEQISVIVVVKEHQTANGDVWLQRYRRLFSSLNRYAKPTDADTNIIMDEDDVFAIITRRIISEHWFFRTELPEQDSYKVLTKGKNLKSGLPQFTSLQTLYDMNSTLVMTPELRRRLGRAKDLKLYLQFRPEDSEIDRCFLLVSNIWDALLGAIPALAEKPEQMRAHNLQVSDAEECQDNLLFWPIGQELLAEATRSLLDRAGHGDESDVEAMTETLEPLALVPWELHGPPWVNLLLVPDPVKESTWRMRNEDRKAALGVARRLIRWIAGIDTLSPDDAGDLRTEWKDSLYPEPEEHVIEEMWEKVLEARGRVLGR